MSTRSTRERAYLVVRAPNGRFEKTVLSCSVYGCYGATKHVVAVGSNKSREVIRLCDSHVNILWKALGARIGRNLT